MTFCRRLARIVSVGAGAALALACGGPSDALHRAVLDGTHANVQADVSFGAGHGLIGLARLIVPDGGAIADSGVTNAAVEVFELEPGSPRPHVAGVHLAGWDRVLRVRDAEDEVVILARSRRGEIREMALVALDGEDLVLIQVKGRLGEALSKALSGRLSPSEIVEETGGHSHVTRTGTR